MLKLAIYNSFSERTQLASAPVIIDRKPEYKVSWIVDSKINCQKACKLLYKIIWLGYVLWQPLDTKFNSSTRQQIS